MKTLLLPVLWIFSQITYILVRIVWWIMENLPVRLAYFLAEMVGTLLYYVLPRRRRLIAANLAIVYPAGPPFDTKWFGRQVFIHACYTVVEFALASRLLTKDNWQQLVTGPGLELLHAQKLKNQGAPIVTLHLGNFLVAGYIPSFIGYPLVTVIHPLKNKAMNRFYAYLFERAGHKVVQKRDSYETLKNLIVQGYSPILVADQYAGSKGLSVDFFGKKAYTVAGPVALARHANVPLFVGTMVRSGRFRFTLHLKQLDPVISDNKQADLERMAAGINKIFEEYILQYPEQWYWMHRRWR